MIKYKLIDPILNAWDWIKRDWREHHIRFIIEVLCWANSLACSFLINSTVPDPPWLLLYPMYITGTSAYAWCAWSRGSFGMLITFTMLAAMDAWGFTRIIGH